MLGKGTAGKAGVGCGRCSRSVRSRVHALLPAGGRGAGRAEGAGAPDTCWGCQMLLPDAARQFWLWECLAGAGAKSPLSQEKKKSFFNF